MKKSKKIFISVITFVLVFSVFFIYANRKPNRPITNLEFWIGDNVEDVNFSGYELRPGLFGGRE